MLLKVPQMHVGVYKNAICRHVNTASFVYHQTLHIFEIQELATKAAGNGGKARHS
jgi:hypothetical protein